ncbi:MAG TPA: MHYT domain-containing protein [Ideonella sp.]|uniref:MHYT domain-containing protein n=1 Tax=Ideonella sp. TaxID=1929293 RepID=UPI002B6C1BCF|nr:MHYT domain-containing protein [Ideonella sp.]HSI50408.1 MHYT domain-containing protein [Ideonella sp.]
MALQSLVPSYDPSLVAASFVISAVGAYSALAPASLVRGQRGLVSRLNALLAGLALGGVGIWSMHFLGMLAWKTSVAVGYQPLWTWLSLAAAVLASAAALGYLASGPFSYRRLAVAGPLTGMGVSVMHFLGMASMQFGGFLLWNWSMVALAVGIAVVAATAALWLAFHVRSVAHRVAASLVMAAAVCAMHYTGMAAANAICETSNLLGRLGGLLYNDELQFLVITVAACVSTMVAADAFLQRTQRQQQALEDGLTRQA